MPLQRRIVVIARNGGSVARYPVTPKVDMIFERTYKVGIANAFSGDGGATNLYRLAWEAERASGAVVKDFEAWLGDVDAIDLELEDVVPFVAGAQDGGSPTSPSPPV